MGINSTYESANSAAIASAMESEGLTMNRDRTSL